MDRETTIRTVVAVVLSVIVMVGLSYLRQRYYPAKPPERPPAESQPAAVPDPQIETAPVPAVPAAPRPGIEVPEPAEGAIGQAPIVIQTERADITLSARGGRVLSWKLRRFENKPGHPADGSVDLVSLESQAMDRHPLVIDTGDPALTKVINDAWYQVDDSSPSEADLAERNLPAGTVRRVFTWSDGAGLAVRKAIYFPDDGRYLARVEWKAVRDGEPLPNAMISWGPGMGPSADAGTSTSFAYRGPVVVGLPEGVKRLDPRKLTADAVWPPNFGPRFLALDEQYFTVAMIPIEAASSEAKRFDIPGAPDGQNVQLAIGTASSNVMLFAGPKLDPLLQDLDKEFGTTTAGLVQWGYFGFLAKPLYIALGYFHELLANWGLAIVLMTIIIRLAFFPLTHRSMVKMRQAQKQMAKLQPKVHKLKEKYKDKRDMESRRQMNEEMMALYKREGVNPAATLTGCLPMLLQLPVLYAMYTVLTVSVQLRGAPFFGWISDLSAPDPYWITPLVMGATQFLQQVMTMTKTEDPQMRSQQRMMLFMPILFTYFFVWMPAGLVIYWLVNNVVGIVQQVFINRHADAAAAAAGSELAAR